MQWLLLATIKEPSDATHTDVGESKVAFRAKPSENLSAQTRLCLRANHPLPVEYHRRLASRTRQDRTTAGFRFRGPKALTIEAITD